MKRTIWIFALMLAGCWETEEEQLSEVEVEEDYTFAEATETATAPGKPVFALRDGRTLGLDFVHMTGADGRKLMPETMGPGCGIVDLTGNGVTEIVFVDGADWDPAKRTNPMVRVYGRDDERYTDITASLGLAGFSGYGMGLAAADYDADGDMDMAVTGVFGVRLLRNDGGSFTDVTGAAGLNPSEGEWSSSASWLDTDGDGWLDLIVANYVRWTVESDIYTTLNGTDKSYATPTVYEGMPNRLYRNDGAGVFTDVAPSTGLDDAENKALGIAVGDFNGDLKPDVFVSNDTTANKAYFSDGAGGFIDMALVMGVAYDDLGRAKAGMGTDVANIEGGPVIAVGNFSDEAVSHFEEVEPEVFAEGAQKRGLGVATRPVLTFGLRFGDFNADGKADLVLGNGHIEPEIGEVQSAVSYAQPLQLYLGGEDGRYADPVTLGDPMVARCVAVGDLDGDIDQDVIVTVNGGTPVVLENMTGAARQILVDLEHPNSPNRDGIGATVAFSAGEWSKTDMVRPRGSYLGHSPYTLHAAAPKEEAGPATVRITWPDGLTQTVSELAFGQRHRISYAPDRSN